MRGTSGRVGGPGRVPNELVLPLQVWSDLKVTRVAGDLEMRLSASSNQNANAPLAWPLESTAAGPHWQNLINANFKAFSFF